MATEHPEVETSLVVDALVQLSFAVLDVVTRSAAAHDLSVTQLRLIGILRDRTPTMAALAGFLRLDRSSVSGLIDRAERRGLVARRQSTEDARVTTVELTADGARLGATVVRTVHPQIERLLDDVEEADREILIRLSDSVLATESVLSTESAPGTESAHGTESALATKK
jgi:DNA-binding MarR family transcriptional regulator